MSLSRLDDNGCGFDFGRMYEFWVSGFGFLWLWCCVWGFEGLGLRNLGFWRWGFDPMRSAS